MCDIAIDMEYVEVTKSVTSFFLLQFLEVIELIKINGEQFDISDINVKKYLIDSGYDLMRVAVELNGEILPKSEYENTNLNDGDSVEVVSFVGGG